MKLKIPPHIQGIRPYSAGKPIEELARETGAEKIIKLASNENPLGPSPLAVEALRGALEGIHRYPDASAFALAAKLSRHYAVEPDSVVVGNGSDDLIGMLTRALLSPGDQAIMGKPSFLMYDIMVRVSGAVPVAVPLAELTIDLDSFLEKVTEKTRMVFVCNPNNPTGTVVSRSRFESFLKQLPDSVVVVIDEAYAEFVRDPDSPKGIDYLCCGKPVVILRTFSKAYGLAGLRVGYGIMPAAVASLLHRVRQPFTANLLGQLAAAAALDDTAFLEKTVRLTHEGLDFLYRALEGLGIRYFPTQTNFLLIDVQRNADEVYRRLLDYGVIVRSMTPYEYPTCIRANVGLPEENARFIEVLQKVLS